MTAHALLSASASSRWLACPPSARLEARFPDGQSPYAAEGTQAHALAEGMLQPYEEDGGVPFTLSGSEWPKDMLDYVDVYVSIVLEKLNKARKKTPDAVLLVEQRLDFSPWVPEGFGTGDAVVISDNTLEIIDLKYGKGVPVSAEDNSQMRLYALGAFHNYGILYDFDRITMTIVQPRLDSVSSQTVDLKDLLDWGDKVKLVAAKAWRGEGEYCAGPHCRFCRAAVRCKKLAEYNLDCLRYEFMAADLMDPEDIVEVLKVEADVTSWLKTVKEYALDQAVNHGEKFPGMKLVEVTDLVKDCGFSVFADAASQKGWSVRGINAKGQGGMGRKQIDKIVEMARGNGAKGLPYIQLKEDGSVKCSFAKFVSEEEIQALVSRMGGEAGDLLFFAADKNGIVWNVLGALRLKLGEDLGLIDHNQFNFLWVVDFPLLEWSEEENRYVAMHHPFTMPVEEDWERIDTDPGSVRAKAYDIVLNGVELGGGSVRIHQSDIQEKMFEVIGLSKEEANEKFGFLLTAFKYGVPPHAGLAYGVDRFVMLLTGADSIREVIAFPKNKDAADLMSGAPDVVDPVQLTDLHIGIEKEEEKTDM